MVFSSKFKASLGYIVRLCLKKERREEGREGGGEGREGSI
jgi:hypothetical protein